MMSQMKIIVITIILKIPQNGERGFPRVAGDEAEKEGEALYVKIQ